MNTDLNLRQIVTILWRKVWLLILIMILFGAAAFSYSYWLITPLYSATTAMYVYNQQNRANSSITSSDLTTSQKLVSTYIVVLKSNSVLDKVSRDLDNKYSAQQIRKMLSASSIDGTEAFEIKVTHRDPEVAQTIANTIAYAAPAEIIRVVKAGAVEVIDYAGLPETPSYPNIKLNTAIGAFAGLAVAILIVLLMAMADTKVHTEEDLTEVFEIPILGVIPKLVEGERGVR